jgi:type II secretory pathway pseudopilin PulG
VSRSVFRSRRASRARGFTLVELMVALTGGLFVSVAVFMLAKQATGLYQSEARMSNATLGSVIGFERLRLDIERASFLASPNLRRDPKRCGVPDASWPAYLSHLAGIFIEPSTTTGMPVQLGNGITPDEITLAGSYASADSFPAHSITATGTNHVVQLETSFGGMARLGYQNMISPETQKALLDTVFGAGRALRIVDPEGNEQYGTILTTQGGQYPTILLQPTSPNILYRGTNTTLKCGVSGVGLYHTVNVVNIVHYAIRNMTGDARFAALFSAGTTVAGAGATPTTDVGRTELVREELDTSGNPVVNSQEIIAEFAVDLSFGVTVSALATGASGSQLEQLQSFAPGATTTAWAGNTTNLVNVGPQRIRGVRARLSVRSREADRLGNMPSGGIIGPGLFRIGLGAGGIAPFARVRTVQADIAIRNQRGVAWL